MKIELKHRDCGGIAFLYEEFAIRPGQLVVAKLAEYPDGSKPTAGEPMICHSCKRAVRLKDISRFRDDLLREAR